MTPAAARSTSSAPTATRASAVGSVMALCMAVAALGACRPGAREGGSVVGTGADGGSGLDAGRGSLDGSTDAGPSRGPVASRPGLRFPFPQNRESAACAYPTGYRNEDVQAAYDQWKRDTVTSVGAGGHMRVMRPHEPLLEPDTTVSEGIGYGMIIAVFMGDQTLFDELWKYEQMYLDGNGLMDWYISADGQTRLGTGGATDADEDMGFALLMADKQWGGQGTLDKPYIDHARDQITKIWNHEILDSKLAGAGDQFLDWNNINISYFAPAYYRLFKAVNVPGADWDSVIKTAYDTIGIALNSSLNNQGNGLVPAWCASHDTICSPSPGMYPNGSANYQYDSCRTPFRIGLDWCMFREPRAQAYVAKTSAFFSGVGVGKIADGYALDGTPQPANPGQGSAAFIGPAAVGAMGGATTMAPTATATDAGTGASDAGVASDAGAPNVAAVRTFLNQAYSAVATRTLLAGGTYYEDSWTVMSLLMLTGNFVDYTSIASP